MTVRIWPTTGLELVRHPGTLAIHFQGGGQDYNEEVVCGAIPPEYWEPQEEWDTLPTEIFHFPAERLCCDCLTRLTVVTGNFKRTRLKGVRKAEPCP